MGQKSNHDLVWRRVGTTAWVGYYLLAAPLACLGPLFVIALLGTTLGSEFQWLSFGYLTALLTHAFAYFAAPISFRRGKGTWTYLPIVVMMANYLIFLGVVAVANLTGRGAQAGYDALVVPYVCLLIFLLALAVYADPGFFRRIRAR